MTDTIAQDLYQKVEDGESPAQHTTTTGLTITLQRKILKEKIVWILSLSRYCQQATIQEREKVKEAFRVPKDADWTPTYKKGWGIIRYTWLETRMEQLQLLAGPGDDFNWQDKFLDNT